VILAGIKVTDSSLVRDAIELARSSSEPFLFNHVMRSWLFGILLLEGAEVVPDPELLGVSAILHDLGLTDRYTGTKRFEVDGANAALAFLKGRGISTQDMQVVWDAIALHTTRSIALHKQPEVAMTHSGVTADDQICALPPSTNSSMPVTKLESSQARNSAVLAISSGFPIRPIGMVDTILAMASAGC
jgi:HD domain